MVVMKAGVAKTKINPIVGAPMAGYIAREGPSKGLHDDLFAKALVMDDGKKEVAVITADLIGVDGAFVAKVRKAIERKTGINRNNILISASHTHSGPVTVELWPSSKIDKQYLKTLEKKLVKVVVQAQCKKTGAKIGFGRGRANVGISRRGPRGPVDREVGVIRIDNLKGNTMAIIINYTCHPTVLSEKNLMFSADYPGYVTGIVEKNTNGVALFTAGAMADVGIRYLDKESSFRRAKKVGSLLAREILKVYKKIKTDDAELGVGRKKIKLRSRKLSDLLEMGKMTLQKTKEKIIHGAEGGMSLPEIKKAQINMEGAIALMDLVRSYRQKEIEVEIQMIGIGNTALVAVPAELSVVVGNYIKRKAKPRNAIIVGYANGYAGYIPPKELYQKGGYEVMVTPFYPSAEKRIRETILNLLTGL